MGRKRIHPESSAARSRAWRARQRLDRLGLPPDRPPLGDDARAVTDVGRRAFLRVPAGHPHAGRPFVLADWQIAVLDDVLTAPRNAAVHRAEKCEVRTDRRAGAGASVRPAAPRRLALRRAVARTAARRASCCGSAWRLPAASGLEGLQVRRTPWPGRLIGDGASDTARSKVPETNRRPGTPAGTTSPSLTNWGCCRNGTARKWPACVAACRRGMVDSSRLTIHGSGPFVPEILARKGAPGLAIHHFARQSGSGAWTIPRIGAARIPGLGTIKIRVSTCATNRGA